MIFPRLRHLNPYSGQDSSGGRAFRLVLLTVVLILVAWGFWTNMERRMERLGITGQILDTGHALSSEEKKNLEVYIKRFRNRFDLLLEIRVLAEPFRPDSWQGKSVLLAVVPQNRQVVFTAPPLVRRALGEEFMADLVDAFAPAFTDVEPKNWKEPLFQGLNTLERKLAELTH